MSYFQGTYGTPITATIQQVDIASAGAHHFTLVAYQNYIFQSEINTRFLISSANVSVSTANGIFLYAGTGMPFTVADAPLNFSVCPNTGAATGEGTVYAVKPRMA